MSGAAPDWILQSLCRSNRMIRSAGIGMQLIVQPAAKPLSE
jgi:hypothetical protein